MAHVTISSDQIQVVLPPAAAPGLVMPEPAPSPEQLRAVEAVFAQDAESEAVAGLWGMWAGTLVLHAVAVDTFGPTEEEEKTDPRKQKQPETDPPQP
jgi:hypothetical protein